MSIVNLGLQCVGLMRTSMSDADEAYIANCNSLAALKSAAEKQPNILSAIKDSIEPAKLLLHEIFARLYAIG